MSLDDLTPEQREIALNAADEILAEGVFDGTLEPFTDEHGRLGYRATPEYRRQLEGDAA